MKLADKTILASLTDERGYGLLILEGNIAVMDLGNGYEGEIAVGCEDLSKAFDKWLGDTRPDDHADNEVIQFVAFSLGLDANLEAIANRLGYEAIEWDSENDCYSGSGSSDPYDRSKDDGKFHVASSQKELANIWSR